MTSTSQFTLTEAERDLLPSDAEAADYAEHGWYLSRKLFTDDEVDALVAATERFYAGHRDRTLPGPAAEPGLLGAVARRRCSGTTTTSTTRATRSRRSCASR